MSLRSVCFAVSVALWGAGLLADASRADTSIPFDDSGPFSRKAPDMPSAVPPGFNAFNPAPAMPRGANPGVTTPFAPPPQTSVDGKTRPAPVRTRAEILDDLFRRLEAATDTDEASGLAAAIQRVWQQSGSDTADLLMARAGTAIGAGETDTATQLLDKLVVIDPDWAEAWNRRAILRFLHDDDFGAMDDVRHVLALEPRHFGALTGMAFILERHGMDKQALTLLRKVSGLYPHNETVEKQIDDLTLKVEGRDL